MWISPKATTFLGVKKFEISDFGRGADEDSQVFWYLTQYRLAGSYRRFQGNTVSSSSRSSSQREVLFLNHLTLKLCTSKMSAAISQSTWYNTTENLNLQANNDMKYYKSLFFLKFDQNK